MSDLAFRLMTAAFRIQDALLPYIDRRVRGFGLAPGMTVVDYGCGPGRYSLRFSRLVGEAGKGRGYDTGLPTGVADRVCAIDMFFSVRNPGAFLAETERLLKPEGLLILDDGHQSRATTHAKLTASGRFELVAETRDHLICRKLRAPGAPGR
jgi:cyclopropane fatty-acyl-phospholipid synthase-like methyltransferase